ncbi:MAG: hypothetical protein KJ000_11935 [Pirellulaceae bacterium]|nr:hypothetical protein [Pirellulaceae bacterium]
MNEQYLMDSARKLCQPPELAAAEFESVAGELASELNRRMAARPDLERLIGADNRPMMEDNSRNFCRFMSAMFHAYEPEVLVQTALWVFRAYRAHGFHTTYWPANLDTFVEIARQRLTSETFAAVEPFFDWLIVNIPVLVKISDEQLAQPLGVQPAHESGSRP